MLNNKNILTFLFCLINFLCFGQYPKYSSTISNINYKLENDKIAVSYHINTNLKVDYLEIVFHYNDLIIRPNSAELSGVFSNINRDGVYTFYWDFLQNPYFKDGKNILMGQLQIELRALGTKPQIIAPNIPSPPSLISKSVYFITAGSAVGGFTSSTILWSNFKKARNNLQNLIPIVDSNGDGIITSIQSQSIWDNAYQNALKKKKPILQYSCIGIGILGTTSLAWIIWENVRRKNNIDKWEKSTGKKYAEKIKFNYSTNTVGIVYFLNR